MRKKVVVIIGLIVVVLVAVYFVPSIGYSTHVRDNITASKGIDVVEIDRLELWNSGDSITIEGPVKFHWAYMEYPNWDDYPNRYVGGIVHDQEDVILKSSTDTWSQPIAGTEPCRPNWQNCLNRIIELTSGQMNVFDMLGEHENGHPPNLGVA